MAVTQIIKLDLNNHKADDIIIRVGESYTRKIVFIPGTYDGDDFVPTEFYGREEGPRAMFRLVKPDRTFVLQNLTVVHEEPDTGIYSFELVPDEYMSQVAGVGYYDLRINDSDTEEEFLYTVQGRVLIDDDMITDSMIESVAASNGMIFPDDFLTIDSFDPDDYATKEYVDDAIAGISSVNFVTLYTNNAAIGETTVNITDPTKYKLYIFQFYHNSSDLSSGKVINKVVYNEDGSYPIVAQSTSNATSLGREVTISGGTISFTDGIQPGVRYDNTYMIPHKIIGMEV